MPRDTRLTLWPEQVAFFPLSNSWGAIRNTQALDFSFCTEVRSCGLASTVLMIKWLFKNIECTSSITSTNAMPNNQLSLFSLSLNQEKNESGRFVSENVIGKIYENNNNKIMDLCIGLGFFSCIDDVISVEVKDKYRISKKNKDPIRINSSDVAYPILLLQYDKFNGRKREMVDDFLEEIYPIVDAFFQKNKNKANQLAHVLEELVKNIADHAQSDGVVGVDVSEKCGRQVLSFVIGDTGPGIYAHMRYNYLKFKSERDKKSGLAEVYRYALQDEVSGSNGPDNYGCGMSTIINNCIAIGASLSVFDEKTRLVLSSLSPIRKRGPSHNEIWRVSFRFDGQKPFFYYLECEDS